MPSIAESPVLEAKRRAKDYRNVDGLPTLVIGLFFLLFVAIAQTPEWLGERLLGWLFVIALYEFRDHAIVEWLKNRITYPRTGYVAPPDEPEPASPVIQLNLDRERTRNEAALRPAPRISLRAAAIAIFLAIPLSMWGITALEHWIGTRWIEAAFFILLGMANLPALSKNKLAWIDAGFILAGFAIAILPIEARSRFILLFLAPGIVFTLRGAITLALYLRRNPVVQA